MSEQPITIDSTEPPLGFWARMRAYLLGGQSRIESAPGAGTLVELRLPLGPGAEA